MLTDASPTVVMNAHRLVLRAVTFLVTVSLTVPNLSARAPYAGNDADLGVSRIDGLIDAYTGNLAFAVRDLVMAGSVYRGGFGVTRHATSRTQGIARLFGEGHNWAHQWQWELTLSGAAGSRKVLIREPAGWVHAFTESTTGAWTPAPDGRHQLWEESGDFRLLKSSGEELIFESAKGGTATEFRLAAITDEAGNTCRLDWRAGRLHRVTEPAGRWLEFEYSHAPGGGADAWRITAVKASDGQTVRYRYGGDGSLLVGVDYPDGNVATYSYTTVTADGRALLDRADDPRADAAVLGRTFSYWTGVGAEPGQIREVRRTRDDRVLLGLAADADAPRAYALTADNGETRFRRYHPGGNLAEEIDATGHAKRFEYSSGGRGFRSVATDELGRVTRFEHGAFGKVRRQVAPDGSARSWEYDHRGRVLTETDELGQVRRYHRDARGRVVRIEYPDGSAEETDYNEFGQILSRRDAGGAVTRYSYDGRGLRTAVTNALGATTRYSYDAFDRLASVTDAHGATTRYERDASGRITRTLFADGTAIGTEYDRFGRVVRTTDAAGGVRTTEYDDLGRLVATTDAAGNRSAHEYAGDRESAPLMRATARIAPDGARTVFDYDAEGRLIARTEAAGTPQAATTRYAYDAAGREISITNPLGRTVQFFHDERGRRVRTMSALGHATTTAYDAAGRKVRETDPKGNVTTWARDAMGREIARTDALGHTTRRSYDAAGRLASLTDAKGSVYRFEYDALGRQTALVFPDESRESTAWDASGRKLSETNRAGATRTFGYDLRGRETVSEWSDGSQRMTKAYDAAGRMTVQDNGVSRITYEYDAAGRLVSETQDLYPAAGGGIDPAPRTIRYTYDAAGRRASLTYPDGTMIRYSHDARGQLTGISDDEGLIASYDYDLVGNATRMPRMNETETERGFDEENRASTITENARSAAEPLAEFDYTHDATGNRTATLTTLDRDGDGRREALLDSYQHDATHQLTGVDYAAPTTGIVPPGATAFVGAPASRARYAYDAVGNRLSVDENGAVTRYAVNSLNQYTQVGAFTPAHDGNGNLSAMGRWLYRYDATNRLVEATDGATRARFFYDGKNRCVARHYTRFAPTGALLETVVQLNTYADWNLIEERDGTGATAARYVHGRRIDEIVRLSNRHGVFYPHHDALGNVTMLTDARGRLAERYDYSVTGQVRVFDAVGRALPGSAVGNRWMFTGRERLSEVGLFDYRNRLYSAELARFLQTDPIRFAGGDINIYRYVSNSLTQNSDPYGLAAGGIRVNATATVFGGIDISIGVYWDDNGGFDVLVGGGGAVAGQMAFTASATIGATITNAESVEDLRGWGHSAGVAAADGVAIEKSYVWGNGYFGSDLGVGVGMPGVAVQETTTHNWSLLEAFDRAIDSVKGAVEQVAGAFGNWWSGLVAGC